MESSAVARPPSRSAGGALRGAVAFLCDRLSLAVVAVGSVFMVVVFVIVEHHATNLGFYPVVFQHNTDEVQVEAGAAGTGALQTGDRIDLRALTQPQRFALVGGAHASTAIELQVRRGNRRLHARVVASSPDYSPRATLTRDVGTPLCFFLSLGLASALFIMRPRAITLAFYVYTMLMLIKVNKVPLNLAAWPINVDSYLAIQVVYPAAQLMILVFAQRLYGRPSRAWPWFLTAAIVLAVCDLVVWTDPVVWMVYQRFGSPGPTLLFESVADGLLLIAVLAGLAYIASGATAIARGRVTWVIAGIALAPVLDLTWATANALSTLIGNTSVALLDLQDWSVALLPWFGLIGSIFVVYGFLSERVVDFRFVIGRAALYGGVTAVLLLLFGVLEWWAEHIFESRRPAIYVSLFAALAIGFALNALHRRIEAFLNNVFFRDQRRAEEALRRASRALANTSSEKTLIEFLVEEPVRVLGLTEAALFLARSGGAFVRTAAHGWTRNETEQIDAEDPLIVELRAELAPIVLDGRPRAQTVLPGGAKAPSLVVPLLVRGGVFGFVFYGARSNGTPFTGDERALLEAIARSAGAAYDHIDADKSHVRIAQLEARIRELGGVAAD